MLLVYFLLCFTFDRYKTIYDKKFSYCEKICKTFINLHFRHSELFQYKNLTKYMARALASLVNIQKNESQS